MHLVIVVRSTRVPSGIQSTLRALISVRLWRLKRNFSTRMAFVVGHCWFSRQQRLAC